METGIYRMNERNNNKLDGRLFGRKRSENSGEMGKKKSEWSTGTSG